MPSGLKRYYGRGDLHFITFSCYRRRPFLGSSGARNLFVRELARVRREYGFLLLGYVVMPEHVHLLIGEPRVGTPSTVMQVLKQRVSRQLRRRRRVPAAQLRLRFGGSDSALPRFWQRRFHDFNVWSEKKLREKLEYMHRNPVTRRLVAHPKSWPWSSYAFYSQSGASLVQIDPVN